MRNRWGIVLGALAGLAVLGLVIWGIFALLDDDDEEDSGAEFAATMDTAEDDLDEFWNQQMERQDFASRYDTPELEYYDEVQQTDCGDAVANNAFYCPADNTIYLHRPWLEASFDEDGAFAPVFVLAHEWAHVVQHGLEILTDPPFTVEMELQADCFAGFSAFEFDEADAVTDEDLLAAGIALIEGGDPAESPWWDPERHGPTDQRVANYTLGYEEELGNCFGPGLPGLDVPTDSEASGEDEETETTSPDETTTPEDGTDEGDGGDGETVVVSISDNEFDPRELEVEAGTTVEWEWGGSNPHSVVGTSQNSGFLDSGVQTGSGTYEATFDEPGTYEYQCGIHGTAMSARVTVS